MNGKSVQRVSAGLLLTVLLFFYHSCKKCDDTCEAVKIETNFGLLFILLTLRNYDLVDNQDGTVSLKITNIQGELTDEIIYKKCLQGQVYRPLPDNDCRGAGTAGDTWGASLLQYCNTNDNSCNPNGWFVEGPNSGIYTSCTTDTTAGISWYPIGMRVLFELTGESAGFSKDYIQNVFSEIPVGAEIWTSVWSGISDSKAAYFVFPSYVDYNDFKTSSKFALCSNIFPDL